MFMTLMMMYASEYMPTKRVHHPAWLLMNASCGTTHPRS